MILESITWFTNVKIRRNYDHVELQNMSPPKHIFDRCAKCLPMPLSLAFKNNLERTKNATKRDHPRQNRTLRSWGARRAFANSIVSTQRWRISYSPTKKRRNTRVGRKAKLVSLFQIRNKRSIGDVYMPISISIESSWACAFNCPIVMTVRTSRVCWNRSSTASLEGERSDERRREY